MERTFFKNVFTVKTVRGGGSGVKSGFHASNMYSPKATQTYEQNQTGLISILSVIYIHFFFCGFFKDEVRKKSEVGWEDL